MSITIHNGFISSEADLFETSKKIRTVVEPLFQQKFELALTEIKESSDDAHWHDHGFKSTDSIWGEERSRYKEMKAERRLYEEIIVLQRAAEHTFSDKDFAYDILLIPNGNPRSHPLVLIYSEYKYYQTALLDAGVISDYGYWDNSDADPDVTPQKWARRKQAWSGLFGDLSPSQVGLLIPMMSNMDLTLARMAASRAEYARKNASK